MKDLWDIFSTEDFENEVSRDEMVRNREKLLAHFIRCFPDTKLAVWLTNQTLNDGDILYLSRAHDKNGPRSVKLDRIPSVILSTKNVAEILAQKTKDIVGDEFEDAFSCEIGALRARNNDNPVGFLVVTTSTKDTSAQKQLIAHLQQFSIIFGHAILQSRSDLASSALSKLETIISAGLTVEQRIDTLKSLLSNSTGATKTHFLTFLGESSALNIEKDKTLNNLKIDISYNDLKWGSVCVNTRLSTDHSPGSNLQSSDRTAFLVIPILESAKNLFNKAIGPANDINIESEENNNAENENRIANHAIVIEKHYSAETSRCIFTDTDIAIASRIVGIFQNPLGSFIYERKVNKLSQFYDNELAHKTLSPGDLFNSLSNGLFKCKGVSIFEYKLGKKVTYQSSQNGKLCSDSYIERMKLFVSQNSTNCSDYHNLQIGIDCGSINSRVEFFFANEVGIVRLIVVHISANEVSDLDFRFLIYMMSELRVHFKSEDSLYARASELAQIRHAIISPISATSDIIHSFYRLSTRYRSNYKLWQTFRDDKDIWEPIKDAVSYAEAAKLLADSGKYLFLEPGDQSIDRKPLDIKEIFLLAIKNARRLDENETAFVQSITGEETDENGKKRVPHADKALIFLVFLNLIDNAIKYTLIPHSNKHYKQKYSLLDDHLDDHINSGMILINLNYGSTGYTFSVENIGRYISEEEKSKIFIPFGRGRQYMDVNPVTGTGIGLPVSQRIVEGHYEKAKINMTSKHIANSTIIAINTFSFTLPYVLKNIKDDMESNTQ